MTLMGCIHGRALLVLLLMFIVSQKTLPLEKSKELLIFLSEVENTGLILSVTSIISASPIMVLKKSNCGVV